MVEFTGRWAWRDGNGSWQGRLLAASPARSGFALVGIWILQSGEGAAPGGT